MAGEQQKKSPFDFSQDAQRFRAKLWKRLRLREAAAAEELDDDDLTWVNAAGMPIHPEDRDDPV